MVVFTAYQNYKRDLIQQDVLDVRHSKNLKKERIKGAAIE